MPFFKLLLGFAPWLAFLFIAHGSLIRLDIGLGAALALTVLTGVLGLSRGIIFWCSMVFFAAASVAVIGFHSMWTVGNMGILASGTLAACTWLGILLRRPFTLAYAKAQVPPEHWSDPLFLRINYILSAAWGAVFTANALLAAISKYGPPLGEWMHQSVSYGLLIGASLFTSWYPEHAKRAAGGGRKPRPSS